MSRLHSGWRRWFGVGATGVNREVTEAELDRPVPLFGIVVRAVSSASVRYPRSSVTLLELPAPPRPMLVSGSSAAEALNRALDEVLSAAMAEVRVSLRYDVVGAAVVAVVQISGATPEAGREVRLKRD